MINKTRAKLATIVAANAPAPPPPPPKPKLDKKEVAYKKALNKLKSAGVDVRDVVIGWVTANKAKL